MFTGRFDLTGVRSLAELQERTGLSRTTIYRLSREPGFPAVKIGRRVVVDGQRLTVWLEERQSAVRGVQVDGK